MPPYIELSLQTKNLNSIATTKDSQQYNKLNLQLEKKQQSKSQLHVIDETNSEEKAEKNESLNDQQINQADIPFKGWYNIPENRLKAAEDFKLTQIAANQIEFEKMIGQGSFGQIWKGKWRETKVAIKQVKQETIDGKSKNSIKFFVFILTVLKK